jgi:hypothetical protein
MKKLASIFLLITSCLVLSIEAMVQRGSDKEVIPYSKTKAKGYGPICHKDVKCIRCGHIETIVYECGNPASTSYICERCGYPNPPMRQLYKPQQMSGEERKHKKDSENKNKEAMKDSKNDDKNALFIVVPLLLGICILGFLK